jgi:hypothetical protein
MMDPFKALGMNERLDRQLALSMLMQGGTSASEAVKRARLQQQEQRQQSVLQQAQAAQPPSQLQLLQSIVPGLPRAAYSQDMLRLQHGLINREIAARAALPPWTGPDAPYFIRMAGLNASQHPPLSTLFSQEMQSHSSAASFAPAMAQTAERRASPPSSPNLKPDPDGELADSRKAEKKKRGSLGSSDGDVFKKQRTAAFNPVSPSAAVNSHLQRSLLASSSPTPVLPHQSPMFSGGGGGGRGAKAKLRDDFWGKVGKNNSHIHLVNIVLGRLLHEQVQASFKKGGNKVLSNDLIQKILDHKLYGKYAVQDFFASSNKASETVRNTWTRLNFSSDNIRKGLSRYKEQTWQAIERCSFDDVNEEDRKSMDEGLQSFVQTGRFVIALDVALKGIITEHFICVLMQLRLEWNSLCLNCRPEEHDGVVATFLRKYGLNGK